MKRGRAKARLIVSPSERNRLEAWKRRPKTAQAGDSSSICCGEHTARCHALERARPQLEDALPWEKI